MLQNFIPISLVITNEIIKMIQSWLIYNDIELYYPKTNKRTIPKSSNIVDDLGQITHIFSDKTGTLTQNVMEFRMCSVGGSKIFDLGGTLLDIEIPDVLQDSRKENSKELNDLFLSISLCHSVLISKSDDAILYKAQSPDESALINAAKQVDYVFSERVKGAVMVAIKGVPQTYNILNVIEFNSDRKRMSVILRMPKSTILLLTKGADSVIFNLLAPGQEAVRQKVDEHLQDFASNGFRTLCYAMKVIPEADYKQWNDKYTAARLCIDDREGEIERVSAMIETNLTLLGVTAIEDKLQIGVPETIEKLLTAGIKIWVLTGDKTETAINIGYSCNLLPKSSTLLIIRGSDHENAHEETGKQVDSALNLVKNSPQDIFSLVIDGNGLMHLLERKPLLENFLKLSVKSVAVMCCRVSPKQKARVVEVVKRNHGAITLAVGDGANDVSMIQEAHIGVGIEGEEGMQASMAADFSLAQFRFLSRLLLVQGRWCYTRTAAMISNFFYKSVIYKYLK